MMRGEELKPARLRPIQHIPPAPNGGLNAVDWIPDFGGFAWLAYGAGPFVVIAITPSPAVSEKEAEAGSFAEQILHPEDSGVRAVAWAPFNGELAVAAGSGNLYIYEPQKAAPSKASTISELPLVWRQVNSLSQNCFINVIVWTQSGNGLLAAGAEVVMWSKVDSVWTAVWKSVPEQSHCLVSTTWSTNGFAASAANDLTTRTLSPSSTESLEGMVTVWYWDDNTGLEEAKLSHPKSVSMMQWRQSKCSCLKRQILLTCSFDGAVRLWIEIDAERRDHGEASDRGSSCKTGWNFVVGAIIEINQSLGGMLGNDISFMWAVDARSDILKGHSKSGSSHCTDTVERNTPENCEWLIGIGPGGNLSWWSLQFLDDSSPLQSLCIRLWRKGTSLPLYKPDCKTIKNSSGLDVHSELVKAVVHRISGHLSAPPSSVDLFQVVPNCLFNWSRVWPPLTAAGSDTKYEENADPKTSSMKSPWSVTSRIFDKNGFSGTIINTCCHPINEIGVAASVDSNGRVLFWSLNSSMESPIETLNFVHPVWKLSGGIYECKQSNENKYSFLSWAPLVVSESCYLLFIGHLGGFDSVLVNESSFDTRRTFQHEVACNAHLPGPKSVLKLECLQAILLESTELEDHLRHNIMVIGSQNSGGLVATWNVVVNVAQDFSLSAGKSSLHTSGGHIKETLETCSKNVLMGNSSFNILVETSPIELINTYVDSLTVRNLSYNFQQSMDSITMPNDGLTPYNFVTSHHDGSLKFWEIKNDLPDYANGMFDVHSNCVGEIKVSENAVQAFALADGGSKFATVTFEPVDGVILSIWNAESYLLGGGFVLEGKLPLPDNVKALNWLTVGNAQFLLAVAMKHDVLIFGQNRSPREPAAVLGQSKPSQTWPCIASYYTSYDIVDAIWGPQGRLLLVFPQLLCIISQWVYFPCKEEEDNSFTIVSKEVQVSYITSGKGGSHQNTVTRDDKFSVPCSIPSSPSEEDSNKWLSLMSSVNSKLWPLLQKKHAFSLFEIVDTIGGPLPVYHPTALLHYLLQGNMRRAVICMKHLIKHMTAEHLKTRADKNEGCFEPLQLVPPIPLSKLLHFEASDGSRNKLQWGSGSHKLVDIANMQEQSDLRHDNHNSYNSGGSDFVDMSQIQHFIRIIDQCPSIPGLVDTERLELLVLLHMMKEVTHRHQDLDGPAKRFWFLMRLIQLKFQQTIGRIPSVGELTVESKAIAWAFHSDSQENLVDLCLTDSPSWPELKSLAVGFWFTNVDSLRNMLEKVARNQYLKHKDPKHCALLYAALNRKSVLVGLFNVSKDEKDKLIGRFLARNFEEEKHRAAALKNAYVLKGKHQFDLAATFFLFGGDPNSAVSICAKDMKDEQLALVICRLIEGTDGPLAKDLICKQVLPNAEEKRDYWLASLLQWQLGNHILSFWKIVQPFTGLIPEDDVEVNESSLSTSASTCISCIDFDTADYCRMLFSKSSFKFHVGENKATALRIWATMKASHALKRFGLPLEGLDYLSSFTHFTSKQRLFKYSKRMDLEDPSEEHGPRFIIDFERNWISESAAMKVESTFRLAMAMQFLSNSVFLNQATSSVYFWNKQNLQGSFLLDGEDEKLARSLLILDQKYSIHSSHVLFLLSDTAYHLGWLSLWSQLLGVSMHQSFKQPIEHHRKTFGAFPAATELLSKSTEEICHLLCRVVLACSYSMSVANEILLVSSRPIYASNGWCFTRLMDVFAELKILVHFLITECSLSEGQEILKVFHIINMIWSIAFFWLKRDSQKLLLLVQHISLNDIERSLSLLDTPEGYEQVFLLLEICQKNFRGDMKNKCLTAQTVPADENKNFGVHSIEDSKWCLIGFCIWTKLRVLVKKLWPVSLGSSTSFKDKEHTSLNISEINWKCLEETFMSSLNCITTGLNTQLVWFLRKMLDTYPDHPILHWLRCMDFPGQKREPDKNESGDGSDPSRNETQLTDCLDNLFETLVNYKDVSSFLMWKGFADLKTQTSREDSNMSRIPIVAERKMVHDHRYSNRASQLDYVHNITQAIEHPGKENVQSHKPKPVLPRGGVLFNVFL